MSSIQFVAKPLTTIPLKHLQVNFRGNGLDKTILLPENSLSSDLFDVIHPIVAALPSGAACRMGKERFPPSATALTRNCLPKLGAGNQFLEIFIETEPLTV